MTSPSLTYTLTNGQTADASQVMQNFNDIINGLTDGTKDLSISALTCASTATFNAGVNIGNASSDDLTITASLASDLAIKTNNTYGIGSATLGLTGVYFGNGGAGATCRVVSASHATTRTYTIPDCSAAASFLMTKSAQSADGIKTFNDGIVVSDAASQATFSNYQTSSTDTTFTWNGSGSASSSITLYYTRVGDWVTLHLTSVTATTGTNSTTFTSDTALDSWAIPVGHTQIFIIMSVADNGAISTNGYGQIATNGKISILKNASSTAFTNSSTCGITAAQQVTYYVGAAS